LQPLLHAAAAKRRRLCYKPLLGVLITLPAAKRWKVDALPREEKKREGVPAADVARR